MPYSCPVLETAAAPSELTSKLISIGGRAIRFFGAASDPYFACLTQSSEGNPLYLRALLALPPGAVVMDVGANIGITTVQAALAPSAPRVIAVEPSPRAAVALRATLAVNGLEERVTVAPVAVGAAGGIAALYEAEFLAGSHLTEPGSDTDAARCATPVPVTTIDALSRDLDRLDLLKIDVEGFELDALQGAVETLERCAPLLVMEFNSWAVTAYRNLSPRALLDFIRERFGAVLYEGDTGRLERAETTDEFLQLLHRNLMHHGCVDDLLFSPDPARIEAVLLAARRSEAVPAPYPTLRERPISAAASQPEPDLLETARAAGPWFHSIELAPGVFSEGSASNPFLRACADVCFAMGLEGRSVLDIGAWDGFFSFEAEHRGAARVVAADHYVWAPGGPGNRAAFELARDCLGSTIEDVVIPLAETTRERLGEFDVVLWNGLFYHLFDPLPALTEAAAMARHVLAVETFIDPELQNLPRPAMVFYPPEHNGAGNPQDGWGPNSRCMHGLLEHYGFETVLEFETPTQPHRSIFLAFRPGHPFGGFVALNRAAARPRTARQA